MRPNPWTFTLDDDSARLVAANDAGLSIHQPDLLGGPSTARIHLSRAGVEQMRDAMTQWLDETAPGAR